MVLPSVAWSSHLEWCNQHRLPQVHPKSLLPSDVVKVNVNSKYHICWKVKHLSLCWRGYVVVRCSVRQMFFLIKAFWCFVITYSSLTYCHNRHPQKIPIAQKQQATLLNRLPQRRCSPLKEFYSLQELIIERKNDNLFLKSKVFVWHYNNNFGILKI